MFHSATFYLSFHVFSSKSVIHLTYVLELWKLHRSVINNCSHFFCVHVQPVVIDECCYSCPDTALQAAQTRLALCCWAQWWIVGQLYQRLSSDVHYWLVVWHICHTFVIFPYFHSVGNVIIPTDELIFFRGVGIPPTRLHIYIHITIHTYTYYKTLDLDLNTPMIYIYSTLYIYRGVAQPPTS